MFKVIIIGDSGVGKTSIINRYCKSNFNDSTKPTIGVELNTKMVQYEEMNNKLQIWDTAGQERFRGVASSYYKGASGVLLVYDITKLSTFTNLETWLNEVKNNASENVVCVIVGNKMDMQDSREVLCEDAQRFAKKGKYNLMEVSAKDSKAEIEQAFDIMIAQMLENGGKTQQVKPGEDKPLYIRKEDAERESISDESDSEDDKKKKKKKKKGDKKKPCAC